MGSDVLTAGPGDAVPVIDDVDRCEVRGISQEPEPTPGDVRTDLDDSRLAGLEADPDPVLRQRLDGGDSGLQHDKLTSMGRYGRAEPSASMVPDGMGLIKSRRHGHAVEHLVDGRHLHPSLRLRKAGYPQSMTIPYRVLPVDVCHRQGWQRLFKDYCALGGIAATPTHLEIVWGWVTAEEAQTRGIVAISGDEVVGFAHFRVFERPITGTTGLWLDDLFVAPEFRGNGIAQNLIDRIRLIAHHEGRDVVRWTTKRANTVARHLYDHIAVEAQVVVYNATPEDSSELTCPDRE